LLDHVDVLRDPLDLVGSLELARLGLVAEVEPRLDARQHGLEPIALHPLQVRLGQQR
jgi:hypothetical protein